MPTYEYVCTACGHRVEAVQSMTDESLKTCGVCGGELRKVFHAAGIVFKGSGFYATDSRKASKDSESDPAKKDGAGTKDATTDKKDGKDKKGAKKDDSSASSSGSSSGSGDAKPSTSSKTSESEKKETKT